MKMLKNKVNHDLDIKHLITFHDTKSTFNDDFINDLKKNEQSYPTTESKGSVYVFFASIINFHSEVVPITS